MLTHGVISGKLLLAQNRSSFNREYEYPKRSKYLPNHWIAIKVYMIKTPSAGLQRHDQPLLDGWETQFVAPTGWLHVVQREYLLG